MTRATTPLAINPVLEAYMYEGKVTSNNFLYLFWLGYFVSLYGRKPKTLFAGWKWQRKCNAFLRAQELTRKEYRNGILP